ncbi:unnamed protein product, partial [marine sediment metagenome]
MKSRRLEELLEKAQLEDVEDLTEAQVSGEAQKAFDYELLAKYLRPKVEKFFNELDQEILAIRRQGKWPKSGLDYGVLRG